MISEQELKEMKKLVKSYQNKEFDGSWIAPIGSDTVLALIEEIEECWSRLDDYRYWSPE